MEPPVKSNSFVFFSAGQKLSQKDREINSDLIEILHFFKPIDKITGDYESRKKFGLERQLYRKLYENSKSKKTKAELISIIEPKEFKDYLIKEDLTTFKVNDSDENYDLLDEETIILTREDFKNDKKILIVILIYDNSIPDLVIDFDFVESLTLRTDPNYFNKKIKEIENKGDMVCQFFAIDPIKIHETIDDCENNFDKTINNANEKLGGGNSKLEILKAILKIKHHLYLLMILNQTERPIWRITDTNEYELFGTTYDQKSLEFKLAKLFCNRTLKLKSFEKFNFLRMRIGIENNQYVLFLHPYESESNGPIRFPPQD